MSVDSLIWTHLILHRICWQYINIQISLSTFCGLASATAAVVAAEAGVQRAAEASVLKHSQSVQTHTCLMVEAATVKNTATPYLSFRLLTGETHMHAWKSEKIIAHNSDTSSVISTTWHLCISPELQAVQSTFSADRSSPIQCRWYEPQHCPSHITRSSPVCSHTCRAATQSHSCHITHQLELNTWHR